MAVKGDSVEVRFQNFSQGDEVPLVRLLAACHPDTWGGQNEVWWEWKHSQHPGFRLDDIVVAVQGDNPVGCFHSAVFPLLIEQGLVVPVSFDGDFAVLPAARGQDLTGRAYDVTDARLLSRGVVFRGGFTSRALHQRLYRKFGYIFVPSAGATFRKFLGLGPLKEKVTRSGNRLLARPAVRRALARRPVAVNLEIQGLPRAHLLCSGDRVALEAGWLDDAALVVRAPYEVLLGIVEGPRSLLTRVVRAAVFGRLRIRGVLRALPTVAALGVATLRHR
jgi:hypothetical protein